MILLDNQKSALLDLARATIRRVLQGQEPPAPAVEPALNQPAGCFVSLHELATHRLRGCVGRLDASQPLARVVIAMAQAVLEDPRFVHLPVMPHELERLEIELSVLSPLVPASNPLDFDLLDDGIYLHCGEQTGCFLPQVARETGWNKQQLLNRLCTEKMGLPADAWQQSDARLSKFSVVLIGPEPFGQGP